MTPDQKYFTFSVKGSISGDEGTGDADHNFRSTTGNLSLDSIDWMVGRAFNDSHAPLPDPFLLRWSVQYVCGNTPEVIALGNGSMQYRYLLATGLPNAKHLLRLTVGNQGTAAFEGATELRIYKPPLVAN